MRLRLGSEPVLITSVVSAALGLLVTLGAFNLTTGKAAAITAAITAVFALAAGLATRPVPVAVFSGAVTAAADLVAAFGMHVSTATVGQVNMLVLAVLMLVTRGHVTPNSPAPVLVRD